MSSWQTLLRGYDAVPTHMRKHVLPTVLGLRQRPNIWLRVPAWNGTVERRVYTSQRVSLHVLRQGVPVRRVLPVRMQQLVNTAFLFGLHQLP